MARRSGPTLHPLMGGFLGFRNHSNPLGGRSRSILGVRNCLTATNVETENRATATTATAAFARGERVTRPLVFAAIGLSLKLSDLTALRKPASRVAG